MISDNKILYNSDWLYKAASDADELPVELPHTNKEMPLQYFDEKDYGFISYYRHKLPDMPAGKRVFLQLDGVMTAFTARVGDTVIDECIGGYLPHTIELTHVPHSAEDMLELAVDSRERADIPPFGGAIDYLTFGGIYRDAWLYTTAAIVLKECFFKYEITGINGALCTVKCTPTLAIDSALQASLTAKLTVSLAGKSYEFAEEILSGDSSYTLPAFELDGIELWSLETPILYPVSIALTAADITDTATLAIGFRKMELTANGAYLNDKRINLRGLNRHQSYPYVGYAMPKRAQARDAQILKYELGLNLVRSSHYPPSPWFLAECDKLGLLVIEEIPGWQHVSKRADWRNNACLDVKSMITRDYNHACVISWGVRINESQDDDELYTQTNRLARALDPQRPTCGVRCIERSHMLEDIYTMNDFVHDGSSNILRTQERCTGLEHKVPYMVTEFCGHTYPTKRFDQEERLIEHALRHGRVQSLAAQKEDTLGAVGWCAFDYNTHYDFGSGDRICYHGVMDMFRVPKFAAAVYKSQRPVSMGYVLEPLTYWARGERDCASLTPIYVFTNCHKIEVRINGKTVSTYSRAFFNVHPEMQYLDFPPIVVNINAGEWGEHLPELEIVGLENDTETPVISKRYVPNSIYSGISAVADDTELLASEQDVTRIVLQAIDQAGNLLPYLSEGFELDTTLGLEIIGPHRITAIGGVAAFWVRTVPHRQGTAYVTIDAFSGYHKTIAINII